MQFKSNDYFVIDSSTGYIGVGTTTPAAQLHHYYPVNVDETPSSVVKKVVMENREVDLAYGLTGYEIGMRSKANNQVGSESSSVVVKGMDVDLSALELEEDASAYGLYVTVSSNQLLAVSRNALILARKGMWG